MIRDFSGDIGIVVLLIRFAQGGIIDFMQEKAGLAVVFSKIAELMEKTDYEA